MAEAAITQAEPVKDYTLTIRELDQLGRAKVYTVAMPDTTDFTKMTAFQQVALLKGSQENPGPLSKWGIQTVIGGVVYARSLGLDILQGDIFPTGEGRFGISNKAKIKLALRTGNVVGIETVIRPIEGTQPPAGCTGAKSDLECTATISVKGWTKPIVNTQKLSVWYKAKNPNWQGNPEHMLKLNTIAHACELVNPTATEDDEAPPIGTEYPTQLTR